MPITPIPRIHGGRCDMPTAHDHVTACTNVNPLDFQHHSLAWLSSHCPQAAAQLRTQLAELSLIRKTAMSNRPIDIWLGTMPVDDLTVTQQDHDDYDKRPLLSESIADDDDFEAHPFITEQIQSLPTQPTLDDRLVPAGVMSVPITQQDSKHGKRKSKKGY